MTTTNDSPALQHLLNSVFSLSQHEKEIQQITGERFNIFDIVRIGHYEVGTHSPMLAELLNPNGRHGQGSRFLELFIEAISAKKVETPSAMSAMCIPLIDLPDPKRATVQMERSLGELGRVDILISDNSDKKLIIENKIYANDQEGQVFRYLSDKSNPVVVYLTLRGDPPSAFSFDPKAEDADTLATRLICASYQTDVFDWLEACRKEIPTVAQVRESLTQYIQLIKSLTGQNQSDRMNEKIAKTVLHTKENYDAYAVLLGAQQAIRVQVVEGMRVKLSAIGKQYNLEFESCELDKGDIYTGFGFHTTKKIEYPLSLRFEFQSKGDRDLIFGFNDRGTLPEPDRQLLREKFNQSFGTSRQSNNWPAFNYWDSYQNWDSSTWWEIAHEGPFYTYLKELLEKLLAIFNQFLEQRRGGTDSVQASPMQ